MGRGRVGMHCQGVSLGQGWQIYPILPYEIHSLPPHSNFNPNPNPSPTPTVAVQGQCQGVKALQGVQGLGQGVQGSG